MITSTPDVWLAEVMARPVHRVTIDGIAGNVLDAPRGFYHGRIVTDGVEEKSALEALGFRIVDTGITLELTAVRSERGSFPGIRPAVPQDRQAVMEIARNGFRQSRFHLDRAIPREVANEIKAQWAGNYFRGARGDHMVVAEAGDRIVGFLQLLRAADGALVVDLIAVDASRRGQGFGRAMIGYASAAFAKQSRLRVGTQVANTGSLRFYEDLGFRAVASTYALHLHA
jgi:GNAT superfamily N-acetyltransferase